MTLRLSKPWYAFAWLQTKKYSSMTLPLNKLIWSLAHLFNITHRHILSMTSKKSLVEGVK